MPRKLTHRTDQPKRPDRTGSPAPLCDARTLLVLILAVGAGWLAGSQGGWPAALPVGIATAVALHTLLRH